MTMALHCDRCDAWAKTASYAVNQFFTLSTPGMADKHFCTVDCAAQWCAAHSDTAEVIPA